MHYDIFFLRHSVGGGNQAGAIWTEPSFPELAGLLFASESVVRLIHGCKLIDAIRLHPLPKKPDIAWKLRKLALTTLRLCTPLCCSMGQPPGAIRGQKVLLWASASAASTVAKVMLCRADAAARERKEGEDDGCDDVYDALLMAACRSCNHGSPEPLALPFLLTRANGGQGTQGSPYGYVPSTRGVGSISKTINLFLHLVRIFLLTASSGSLKLAVLICGPVPELLMDCIGFTTPAIPMTSAQCDRELASVYEYGVMYLTFVTEAATSIAESGEIDMRLIGQGLSFLLSSPLMDLIIQVSHADAGKGETMAELVGKVFWHLGSLLCLLTAKVQISSDHLHFFIGLTADLNAMALGRPDPGRACWPMDTPTSAHAHFRCDLVAIQGWSASIFN